MPCCYVTTILIEVSGWLDYTEMLGMFVSDGCMNAISLETRCHGQNWPSSSRDEIEFSRILIPFFVNCFGDAMEGCAVPKFIFAEIFIIIILL